MNSADHSLLEFPIRLDHRSTELIQAIAELGIVRLIAQNRAICLHLDGDSSGAILTDHLHSLLPGLGLAFDHELIAAIHASPAPRSPHSVGILELDFPEGSLGFAIPSEKAGIERFHDLIGRFGIEETDPVQLEKRRRELSPSIRMCPCCEAASAKRIARPDLHPLSSILIHAAQAGLELHLEMEASGFSSSSFFSPLSISFDEGIIVRSRDSRGMLYFDLHLMHSLWVLPTCPDREDRASLQAYSSLGQHLFTLSSSDPALLAIWQSECRRYFH
ncbi:hypothetical protein ACFQY0_14205 [Haloferula chungangensis]|uniref:Uncharacterized protein n=1 Tax=Haloferula chungangensis TaxID=1048331 RepID=A0ABW2LBK8_9BACT